MLVCEAPKSVTSLPPYTVSALVKNKLTERIEYKLLSLRPTYKVFTTTQPPQAYLHNLITVQPPRSTRSSYLVTFARPSTSSSLRITDRSFKYAPLVSGINSRLLSVTNLSNSASPSSIDLPLASYITPTLFHSRLKTFLFLQILPTVAFLSFFYGFPGLFTDTSELNRF